MPPLNSRLCLSGVIGWISSWIRARVNGHINPKCKIRFLPLKLFSINKCYLIWKWRSSCPLVYSLSLLPRWLLDSVKDTVRDILIKQQYVNLNLMFCRSFWNPYLFSRGWGPPHLRTSLHWRKQWVQQHNRVLRLDCNHRTGSGMLSHEVAWWGILSSCQQWHWLPIWSM